MMSEEQQKMIVDHNKVQRAQNIRRIQRWIGEQSLNVLVWLVIVAVVASCVGIFWLAWINGAGWFSVLFTLFVVGVVGWQWLKFWSEETINQARAERNRAWLREGSE